MLPSHEKCPVCQKDMLHSKHLNKMCQVVGQNLSFVESICNTAVASNLEDSLKYPQHLYFQVSSLYSQILYQKVNFPFKDLEVEINYTKKQSIITYFSMGIKPDSLIINKIIELDFPKLDKIINRAKVLAVFL